jgi:hypothetical protein
MLDLAIFGLSNWLACMDHIVRIKSTKVNGESTPDGLNPYPVRQGLVSLSLAHLQDTPPS